MSDDDTSGHVGAGEFSDYYDTAAEFEAALAAATNNARTPREAAFVNFLRAQYNALGDRMPLSGAQYAWLEGLSEGEVRE